MVDSQEQIRLLERYFEAGDFKRARKLIRELTPIADSLQAKHGAQLERMRRATSVDPAVIIGFSITFGLILFLFFYYVL